MCDCCRPSSGFIQRHSNYRNHDTCPTPSQWQFVETPCNGNGNSNHATTTTHTQSCHHHTQTQSQSQSLTRTTPPTHRLPTYDIDVFNRPSPNFPCSLYQQNSLNYDPNSPHQRPLESLLRDLLNHTIYNNDTIIPDCAACHALCHVPSQTQRDLQQCAACTADTQQLVSLLLNFLERLNTVTNASNSHSYRQPLPPPCRLHTHNNTASNRHQRTTCNCHPQLQSQLHCPTCQTTHDQTKPLLDVLLRITRRRSQGRNRNRVSTRCRRCAYPHSRSRSPVDINRVIRRLLDEFESNNTNTITCSRGCNHSYGTADRESIDSSLRRLRKALRDMEVESECDGQCEIDDFGEDGSCGCGCGGGGRERECVDGDYVEVSRVTTYTAPAPVERRRPRVGNLHLGWVL